MDWKNMMKKAANVALDVGELYVDDMKSKLSRVEKKMEMYDSWSDDELRRKLKSTSDPDTKMAIIQILKNRGY